VGFVEGHDIFSDKIDVVVTDGFTGNVALRRWRRARLIADTLREEFTRNFARKLGALAPGRAQRASHPAEPTRYNGATWSD